MTHPKNLSLFDDEPLAPSSLVAALTRSKPATKAHQAFQRLAGKIETKRDELARWQAFSVRYQARIVAEVLPLQAKLRNGQRRMAVLIDELLTRPTPGRRLGKLQRAKLFQLLMNLLDGLLEEGGDTDLEALYEKHGGGPCAEEQQEDLALTQAMLEEVFGVDIGDDHGAKSAEELLSHANAKLRERAEAEAKAAQTQETARADKRSTASRAKAQAAEARRAQAEQEVSQSIREVYRKLASALHPDREPDAAERERKTRLMQRVNDANAAKDLLTLLGLQLEIEQIDAEHLASLSPQRLAHFTQVLREQLAELESELAHSAMPFRAGHRWSRSMTPALVDQQLSAEIADLQSALAHLEDDLVAFRDPAQLRESLKHYPLESQEDDERTPDDLNHLLDAFAASMAPPRKPGRGRR